MASYSAFFSSGYLAPRFTDADMQLDYATDESRSVTPTPSSDWDSTPLQPAFDFGPAIHQAHQTQAQGPRLRKRRSSLTVAQSPINAIKSPSRSAATAYMSPSRIRSGSLSTGAQGQARDTTSLVGRMRSGSMGTVLRPNAHRKPSRSAPALPPPTAPLPELPPLKFNVNVNGNAKGKAPVPVIRQPLAPVRRDTHSIDEHAMQL